MKKKASEAQGLMYILSQLFAVSIIC